MGPYDGALVLPSINEMLRESGVLKLPSQRTLRDYTFYTKAQSGFAGRKTYTCIIIYSRTSIIRHGKNKTKNKIKMGVSAAVTMDTGMFIFTDAHIHCCLSIKWVDQGVVYPIRLSSYLAWLKNKGSG